MDSRTFYYARVSSDSQKLDTQLDLFKKLGASDRDIVTDKASGKDMNRPGYQALKTTMLRNGDTLIVARLDRLGRSKEDIKDELKFFKDNGIRVKILDIPTTMHDFPTGSEWVADMVNNILIEVLGVIATRERLNLRDRQRSGIESAHRRNVKFGRPIIKKPDNWDLIYQKWRRREIPTNEAIMELCLKKTTFYKLAEEQLDEDVEKLAKSEGKLRIGDIQRFLWVGYPTAREALDRFLSKHPSWEYDKVTLEAKKNNG